MDGAKNENDSNAATRDEAGWVIEGAWSDPSEPQYWAGSSLWMSDHMCAIRFAREQDAKQAASAMLDGMNVRICEHIWSGATIRIAAIAKAEGRT